MYNIHFNLKSVSFKHREVEREGRKGRKEGKEGGREGDMERERKEGRRMMTFVSMIM